MSGFGVVDLLIGQIPFILQVFGLVKRHGSTEDNIIYAFEDSLVNDETAPDSKLDRRS